MRSLLISGISGKVGSYLYSLCDDYKFNLQCGVDKNTFIKTDCPVYKSFNEVKEHVNVVIDFSSAELTDELIKFVYRTECKLVMGTTALSQSQITAVKQLSNKVAVCYSNNFAKGFSAYFAASEILRNQLRDFDLSLTEIHHKHKKDSPSGTAKYLSEQLNIDQIHSVRGGNLAGVHTMTFYGMGEEIQITHRAYEKSIFARGALICAKALLNKKSGLYSAKQLLSEYNPL